MNQRYVRLIFCFCELQLILLTLLCFSCTRNQNTALFDLTSGINQFNENQRNYELRMTENKELIRKKIYEDPINTVTWLDSLIANDPIIFPIEEKEYLLYSSDVLGWQRTHCTCFAHK